MMLYPCASGPECKLLFKFQDNSSIPTIGEIWNGPEMIRIRRQILDGRSEEIGCSGCEFLGSGMSLYEHFDFKDASDTVKNNAHLNIDEFLKGQVVLKSSPLYISADLSYACNLKCALCEVRFYKSEMSPHQISDLFTKYAGTLRHMHISGGEPLMHKEFLNYLGKPPSKPPALSITTNGSFLSEEILEHLAKFDHVNLHISCDSFTERTLKKMRSGSDYKRIIKNIRRASKFKNKINEDFGDRRWHVCLQYVPTILNIREFPEYLDHANDIGVDSVASCTVSGDFPDYDFMRYPHLLDNIDTVSLLHEISVRLEKYSHLEIYGLDSFLKFLEGKV